MMKEILVISLLITGAYSAQNECNLYSEIQIQSDHSEIIVGSYSPEHSCRWKAESPKGTKLILTCENNPYSQASDSDCISVYHAGELDWGDVHHFCGPGLFSIDAIANQMEVVILPLESSEGGSFVCNYTVKNTTPMIAPQLTEAEANAIIGKQNITGIDYDPANGIFPNFQVDASRPGKQGDIAIKSDTITEPSPGNQIIIPNKEKNEPGSNKKEPPSLPKKQLSTNAGTTQTDAKKDSLAKGTTSRTETKPMGATKQETDFMRKKTGATSGITEAVRPVQAFTEGYRPEKTTRRPLVTTPATVIRQELPQTMGRPEPGGAAFGGQNTKPPYQKPPTEQVCWCPYFLPPFFPTHESGGEFSGYLPPPSHFPPMLPCSWAPPMWQGFPPPAFPKNQFPFPYYNP